MNKRHRILLVDDQPRNLAILERILRSDYRLMSVGSGDDALRVAETFHPQVVLLDIMMPGIDGYETCRRLRKSEGARTAKIIMVSAKAMLSERLEGYAAGADDYLTKPFDQDELLEKVRVYVRLRSAEELERLRGHLISLVRHELRAPLTAMVAAVDALRCGGSLEPDQMELVTVAVDASASLQALLDKVVLLSRVKSDACGCEPHARDGASLVREVLVSRAGTAAGRGVRIESTLAEEIEVELDDQFGPLVVGAILDNAIRFTPPGGTVTVRLAQVRGDLAEVHIVDEGPGIAPETRSRLFDPFGTSDTDDHHPVRGFSLAIAHGMAANHGASVDIECNGGERGAHFVIGIPLVPVVTPAVAGSR